jgi:hypothetical protein
MNGLTRFPTGPAKYLAKPLPRKKFTWKDPVELESSLDIQLTYNKMFFNGAVVVPFILSNRSNGAEYLNFLQTVVEDDLDNIRLQNKLQMWWMQDGAPSTYS